MDRALFALGLAAAAVGTVLLGLSLWVKAGEERLLTGALGCLLVAYLLNVIRHLRRTDE